MPPRHAPTGDPLLKGPDWSAVRAYWLATDDPCARCGGWIDRTPGARGPRALDVGHIVSRDEARAMDWTRAEINALSNTQPECRRCSRSSGAAYGNRKRGRERRAGVTRVRTVGRRPIEADEW